MSEDYFGSYFKQAYSHKTGLIHSWDVKNQQMVWEKISVLDNIAWVFYLMQSKTQENFQMAKQILFHMLHFHVVDENTHFAWPQFLHEYPQKGQLSYQLELAFALVILVKTFGKFSQDVEKAILFHLEKLAFFLEKMAIYFKEPIHWIQVFCIQTLCQKKLSIRCFSSIEIPLSHWVEQLFEKQIEEKIGLAAIFMSHLEERDSYCFITLFSEWLSSRWHFSLFRFLGKNFHPISFKEQLSFNLIEELAIFFFEKALAGKYISLRPIFCNPLLKEQFLGINQSNNLSVLFSQKKEAIERHFYYGWFYRSTFLSNEYGREQLIFELIFNLDLEKQYSLQLFSHLPSILEKKEPNLLVFHFNSKDNETYEKYEHLITFFISKSFSFPYIEDGVKATLFRKKEKIFFKKEKKKIVLWFDSDSQDQEYIGHIFLKNRTGQIDHSEAYDWQISLRVLNKVEKLTSLYLKLEMDD